MKHKIIISILISFSFAFSIRAQYVHSSIPDSLTKDASYIIWEDYRKFKVISPGEAVEHVKFAVLIANKFATSYENISIRYSKNMKIKSFSGEIYDASGQRIKKLKNSDIQDVSAVSGGTLYADSRRKILHFNYNNYPYTIVYEYERSLDGILNYPSWSFQSGFKTSVLSSRIDFIIPKNMEFNYKEYNLNNESEITDIDDGDNILYRWEETMLPAKEWQELLPPSYYYRPTVLIAPKDFEMENYQGSLNSWEEFGQWSYTLNKDRDVLPEELKNKVAKLTKDAEDDREKAKILYEYMQNKTRYVSVQLGIGGWQTFPAEYVDKNGYGDCKALTNYMYSMLKYVGIKSNYVLVRAGRSKSDIITDFPSNQFNHAILCIPQPNDTIWLECTSQKQPFGFLGTFTDNRHVLLVDKEGSKLVKTPEYTKEENSRIRKMKVDVDINGNAMITMATIFEGLSFEDRFGIKDYSLKDQKDVLHDIYDISGMDFTSIKYKVDKDETPAITENIKMRVIKMASISSKRMFVKVNLFSGLSVPEKNNERKLPFKIKRGYTRIDSIHINIPVGYEVEALPSKKNYDTKFGSYNVKVEASNNTILYVRTLIINKGFFPASDYQEYYNTRKKIKKADKAKLVLKKI